MARILIAGCGDIGSAAGKKLADEGHQVYGLKRHPPDDVQGILYIKADLTNAVEINALDTNYDLVIYVLTPDDRSEHAYRQAFVDGVNNLLEVFSRNSSNARFIFISSTSVYGQRRGEWVDENAETRPGKVTAKLLLQAEHAFISHGSQNCIIRFSGIYGRGDSYLLDAVARTGMVQFEPPYYMNRIHRQDCIRVICFIADRMIAGEKVDPIYLASDDDPAPKWEVFDYLAGKLGVQRPGKETMPQHSEQNKRCSNTRLRQLGYDFEYRSYRQGYASVGRSSGS